MAKTPEENRPNINQSCEACGTKWTAMEILPCPTCAPATPAPIAAQTEKPWKRQESCSECDGDGCEMCDPKPKEQVDAARLAAVEIVETVENVSKMMKGPRFAFIEFQAEIEKIISKHFAASLKQETQPPRCPSGAQSGTVTESQRCIECGQTIPEGADCFYYRETGIFVHRKCPASSSPLETPASGGEVIVNCTSNLELIEKSIAAQAVCQETHYYCISERCKWVGHFKPNERRCPQCGSAVWKEGSSTLTHKTRPDCKVTATHPIAELKFKDGSTYGERYPTPAPADTGAAKITSKQDWPAHINVAALKAGAGMLISHASHNGYGILILGIGWYCLGYCAGKPTQRGEVISGS